MSIENPFDPELEPKRFNVAQLLLSGHTISFDDLKLAAGGTLSPRTLGFVLRELEARQLTIMRLRDDEMGTLYRLDPDVTFDPEARVSKLGPDSRRHPPRGVEAPLRGPMSAGAVSPPPEPQPVRKDATAAPKPIQPEGGVGHQDPPPPEPMPPGRPLLEVLGVEDEVDLDEVFGGDSPGPRA